MDQIFSDKMNVVLDEIKQRLRREVRVNLLVEKINCANGKNVKCLQYSSEKSFHWIIIQDPKTGTAVYEVTAKLNQKKATIEASLLNALSQHSKHDLTIYCSKEADKEVGFIRRLTTKEMIEKQHDKSKITKFKSKISRSPLELNLIEPILLEQRSFEESINWHQLRRMNETTLDAAINENRLTFVLFWKIEDTISKHVFHLWAKASELLVLRYQNDDVTTFGALACHEYDNLCDDYITKVNDYRTIFVFKNNNIFGQTEEIGDLKYYINWVKLLMLSPAQEILSENELKQIKAGIIKSFDDEVKPAITVGIFDDRNNNEIKTFMQMAENLKGKYHFVYLIKKSHPNTVYTIRTLEKRKRIDFTGIYEIQELTNFVIHSSLPSIIDISNGFTSDILTHQLRPIILLIDPNEMEKANFAELCTKSSNIICTTLDGLKSKLINKIFDSAAADIDQSSKLMIFIREKIYRSDAKIVLESDNLLQIIAIATANNPIKELGLEDVHPLRYIQKAQIDEIFGEQTIEIPSEMEFIQRSYLDKGIEIDDNDNYGGCPVMGNARKMMLKDEL
uniref:Uncharacterized protein n=1 Tax=Setaria digitata TaxID=48799 RepID=A0A915Q7T7_9BILA